MKKDLLRRLLKLSFATLYALLMVFSGCTNPSGDDGNPNSFSSFEEMLIHLVGFPGGWLNPFLIRNEAELRKVGTGQDGWTLEAHYRLEADIILNPNVEWRPIGDDNSSFRGIFDGNNRTITGLRINAPDRDYQGMFGRISYSPPDQYIGDNKGVVKNLGLVNVFVIGNNYVGGLTGSLIGQMVGNSYQNSTIQNCYVSGSVTGNNYVGGLVGNNNGGTIQNSYATSAVTGRSNVGGLTGSGSSGSNSYSTGTVTRL